MMSLIKKTTTYILIALVFMFALNMVSAVILRFVPAQQEVLRSFELPCFDNPERARDIYNEEVSQITSNYKSFTGWQLAPHQGKYFHIDENGRRIHKHFVDSVDSKKSVAIFGGSTVWGAGNAGYETIPAYLDSLNHRFRVLNFGSPAYNSRQGLAQLINAYRNGHKFDYVIFYDGVNEVLLCDKQLTENDHSLDFRYNKIIKRYETPDNVALLFLKHVFLTKTQKLARSIHDRIFERDREAIVSLYDCHTSPDKSKAIASHLIENWKIARDLVHSQGGEFMAILQPQLFTGNPSLDYLGDVFQGDFLKEQYLTVYPEIESLIEKEQASWIHDYTDAFDGNEKIYYDFCHPVGKGNLIIADRLNHLIENSESSSMDVFSESKSDIKDQR